MPRPALEALGRFNDLHPWSHNDVYSGWVTRQARRVRRQGGSRGLDVGCGTGRLLLRLARELPEVIGIEPDRRSAETAMATIRHLPQVIVRQSAFSELDDRQYDLVTFVASLHHLPLRQTLRSARSLVAPGGRLAIVGVARETHNDLLLSLCSILLNPLVGIVLHPRRATGLPTHMRAPVKQPAESFDEIASIAREELPGVTLRRGLFWRYTAVWVSPARLERSPQD